MRRRKRRRMTPLVMMIARSVRSMLVVDFDWVFLEFGVSVGAGRSAGIC